MENSPMAFAYQGNIFINSDRYIQSFDVTINVSGSTSSGPMVNLGECYNGGFHHDNLVRVVAHEKNHLLDHKHNVVPEFSELHFLNQDFCWHVHTELRSCLAEMETGMLVGEQATRLSKYITDKENYSRYKSFYVFGYRWIVKQIVKLMDENPERYGYDGPAVAVLYLDYLGQYPAKMKLIARDILKIYDQQKSNLVFQYHSWWSINWHIVLLISLIVVGNLIVYINFFRQK